jgi:tricarballylate dehydrogenase
MQFEWLKQSWGDAADNFIVRGTPFNKGRMLRVLMDKGAKPVGDPRRTLQSSCGLHVSML